MQMVDLIKLWKSGVTYESMQQYLNWNFRFAKRSSFINKSEYRNRFREGHNHQYRQWGTAIGDPPQKCNENWKTRNAMSNIWESMDDFWANYIWCGFMPLIIRACALRLPESESDYTLAPQFCYPFKNKCGTNVTIECSYSLSVNSWANCLLR